MTNDEELKGAVATFQQAEAAIKELLDEINALMSTTTAFEEARMSLLESSRAISTLAESHVNTVNELADLSKKLVEATEVIRGIDPARLYAELEGLRKDFQSQIERMGALGGELKGKIDASGQKVSTKVKELGTEVKGVIEGVEQRNKKLLVVLGVIGGVSLLLQLLHLIRG